MSVHDEVRMELDYLRRRAERSAAKILSLDAQSIAIRHELEQKRRGFRLLAELAVTLRQTRDYESLFVAVSRRINAALNMQRTAVIAPNGEGAYRAFLLQGYPPEAERRISSRRLEVDDEMLDPATPVLVTGEDSGERLASFREALELPYLISSPVVLNDEVAAILVTGRLTEQPPFLIRLGQGDVETVQAVGAQLSAVLAGRRLAEAEERTQIMLDATPLCCNFWDEHYNNVDCNQEAARLFGFSDKREYLERFGELSPLYQPDGRLSSELVREKIRAAFASGYERFEWMHQKPGGELVPAEITLVRVRRDDHYIVAGYTRDLREQKAMLAAMHKTQDELRLARDLAEKNARAKSEFLANMSHEIRTPMNAVLGMIHLLNGADLSERQRTYVEKAGHSANLLLRIIDDILDFSKIDAGHMQVETAPFFISDLVANVRDMLREPAKAKALALSVRVAPDVPDRVEGDPVRLEQVVLNLANNALKFTEKGGVDIRVSVASRSSGAVRLLFEVEDTGIGMSESQASALFVPFSQADTSTTRKYGGTGLGLAISRSLVELMGGEIRCESRPGEGSIFSFTVMLAVSEGSGDGAGADTSGAAGVPEGDAGDGFASIGGMRVLLAEDNEINQMIAMELLSAKGVDVVPVATGREAIDALENDEYDLVLMDIQMPEMDGLSATAQIRANPKYAGLPIVAMTAHAMTGDREASLEGGMNDHLTKPIDPHLLYATLKRWDKRM